MSHARNRAAREGAARLDSVRSVSSYFMWSYAIPRLFVFLSFQKPFHVQLQIANNGYIIDHNHEPRHIQYAKPLPVQSFQPSRPFTQLPLYARIDSTSFDPARPRALLPQYLSLGSSAILTVSNIPKMVSPKVGRWSFACFDSSRSVPSWL